MSNDFALFIILLPNDFDKEMATISVASNMIKPTVSTSSMNTAIVSIASDYFSHHKTPRHHSRTEQDLEHIPQTQTKSLCTILKNYFSGKSKIEPIWMLSDDKETYQITFYIEFGAASDHILQDIVHFGIGTINHTKIFVLPTTFILGGQISSKKESVSTSSLPEDMKTHESSSATTKHKIHGSTSNDLTLSRKIRKRINESNFKKSVRARLMVHQVVASIRASTALSFDFVLLICLASILAALGLLENSTVVIVASMLVSPLMNPILGFVFGLCVREHSLWRRGLRNELIGLIICITCGFILGLLTTFAGTRWGSTTSFPTSEMKSRGDIKRLWVGALIALPSGAGVALSVLGGNTGSLVGVAISASLLPPAVNCGLLFAYTLLGTTLSQVVPIASATLNSTIMQHSSGLNCPKYFNNEYQPLYTCSLAKEAAALAGCSLLLTIVNILCIIIMALFILRIKEVVPLHQPNEDIANFFHHDVKVARDYNKTIHEGDFETNNLATSTSNRSHLALTLVNRWKTLKSANTHENLSHQNLSSISSKYNDVELATAPVFSTINNHAINMDSESRRKLLRLKTFAKEYDLDVFNMTDYDLLTVDSREKVRLLINDLIDICQEIPPIFVDLFRLQPCSAQPSADKEHMSFYQEIVELLPPKWYHLFTREQEQRKLRSWPPPLNRQCSLRLPHFISFRKSTSDSSRTARTGHRQSFEDEYEKKKTNVRRRSSVPEVNSRASTTQQDIEVAVEGTRFRIARTSVTSGTTTEELTTI